MLIQILKSQVNYPVRYETLEGKSHVVIPVVALVVGVHSGSGGTAYYPAEELSRFPFMWNGRPVTVQHPQLDGQYVSANSPDIIEKWVVGKLFNMTFDDSKLHGEMWIDIAKVNAVDPQIIQLVNEKAIIEVSTGLWSDVITGDGEWNGEKYNQTVINIQPDHVALLPGQQGACSVADGCGVRANEKPKNNISPTQKESSMKDKIKAMLKAFADLLLANEPSHEDTRDALWQWCDAQRTNNSDYWLLDIYDDYFVYALTVRNPESGARVEANKLYKRSYSIDDNGKIAVAAESIEVIEKKEYVPAETPAANTNKEKESTNVKKEKIDALIACECTNLVEADRAWLNELPEEHIDKLGVKMPEPPKTNTEQPPAAQPETKKPQTTEEFINSAPPEIQEILKSALANEQAIKDGLIKGLKENKANQFSDDELKAMSVAQLKKLAAIANVEVDVDYSAQAGAPPNATVNQGAPPMPSTAPEAK